MPVNAKFAVSLGTSSHLLRCSQVTRCSGWLLPGPSKTNSTPSFDDILGFTCGLRITFNVNLMDFFTCSHQFKQQYHTIWCIINVQSIVRKQICLHSQYNILDLKIDLQSYFCETLLGYVFTCFHPFVSFSLSLLINFMGMGYYSCCYGNYVVRLTPTTLPGTWTGR